MKALAHFSYKHLSDIKLGQLSCRSQPAIKVQALHLSVKCFKSNTQRNRMCIRQNLNTAALNIFFHCFYKVQVELFYCIYLVLAEVYSQRLRWFGVQLRCCFKAFKCKSHKGVVMYISTTFCQLIMIQCKYMKNVV